MIMTEGPKELTLTKENLIRIHETLVNNEGNDIRCMYEDKSLGEVPPLNVWHTMLNVLAGSFPHGSPQRNYLLALSSLNPYDSNE